MRDIFSIRQGNRPKLCVGLASPVQQLFRIQRRPLDFPFHVWGARITPELETRMPEAADRLVASGISENDQLAETAAYGEAIERYAFSLAESHVSSIPVTPAGAPFSERLIFDLPFLLPRSLARREWAHLARHSPCRIMPCRRLDGEGKSTNAVLPVELLPPQGRFTIFQTTNGMATGFSLNDAIDRGIREVIERDALMLMWLFQVRGLSVSPASVLPQPYCEMIHRMAGLGVRVLIQDISTEFGYFVFLVSIEGDRDGEAYRLSFGAGAARQPCQAASHAFREASLSWKGAFWRDIEERSSSRGVVTAPRSFAEHGNWYLGNQFRKHLRFILQPRRSTSALKRRSISTCSSSYLSRPCTPMAPKGKDAYVIDLSTSDIRACGAFVVKVVVPGLVPLYFSDLVADELAHARLPIKLGERTINRSDSINMEPHPWP